MPAKFHPVAPAMWDRAMRGLTSDAQAVRCYLMTCSSRVSEGLFHCPLGIIAHDVGMDVAQVEKALAELGEAGFVSYDPDAEVVLDRTALKYAPLKHGRDPETGEVRKNRAMPAAVRLFAGVPDTPLKDELYQLAKRHADDFAGALLDHDPTLGMDDPPLKGDGRGMEGGSRAELSRGEVSRGGCRACGATTPEACWCKDRR